jgi:carbamoyltransferase
VIILGVTDTVCQDNAAAILVDGELVGMVEEERLNRIKHAPRMEPVKAIQWCLSQAKCKLEDVDIIAIGFDHPNTIFRDNMVKKLKRYAKRQPVIRGPRGEFKYWKRHRYYLQLLGPYLKRRERVMFGRHHLAHAASSFFLSPFENANIVSLDGSGGQDAGLLGIGRGNEIEVVHYVDRETSWGEFYERFTAALGFRPHCDEGKVMGLAAYGDPRGTIFPFVQLANGTGFPAFEREAFARALKEIRPRIKGEWPINGYHEQVAAQLQYTLEQVVARMTEELQKRSSFTDLCMAGGTALNCSCNGKLLSLPHVKRIFVQPAAADCGTALGAAVYAHVKLTGSRPRTKFNHLYWGPEFSNDEIETVLKQAKVPYHRSENVCAEAARLIRDNKIVGWFQGRMEVGPRALGGRSILANPTEPRMKDAVNNNVKFREPWRPFAPSILAEHMEEYFGTKHPSPFMILAFQARPEVKAKIPAALHVDGTGRPQTVEKETNPRYWNLINEFKKLTGVPVVMNTSFNVAGQPIVCTPKDALGTFYICGLDALAIGDFIVEKDKAWRPPA